MHFLRARRQRIAYRTFGACYTSRHFQSRTKKSSSGFLSSPQQHRSSAGRSVSYCNGLMTCLSEFHSIRANILSIFDERQALNLYFASQEDPYMREKIAAFCSRIRKLQHITSQYLDRIAQLKLFL